ncbi:MAG: hypothetical protein R3B70_10715 [Polyangiaceae bacterium]
MPFEASRKPRPPLFPSTDEAAPASVRPALIAIPIDSFADASLAAERLTLQNRDLRCDACDTRIEGEPYGSGLFLTTRGDEVRIEEPALCSTCATAIGLRANLDTEIEEEEG